MFSRQQHQDGGSRILKESDVQHARHFLNLPVRNLAAALLFLILAMKSSATRGWLQHSRVRKKPLKLQRNTVKDCISKVCMRL